MKGLKLITLAMLFALPLVGCDDKNKGGSGEGTETEEKEQGKEEEGSTEKPTEDAKGTVTLDFNSLTAISGEYKGVSYKAEKAGAQNDPVVNASSHDMRIYAKGTFTLTVSTTMTKCEFAISSKGKFRQAEIACSAGTMAYDMENSKVTWTGSAKTVKFTVGDTAKYGTDGESKAGQFCFNSVAVTCK